MIIHTKKSYEELTEERLHTESGVFVEIYEWSVISKLLGLNKKKQSEPVEPHSFKCNVKTEAARWTVILWG